MAGRLEGKVAIVVGAGQTPGDTIGNGRATALLFAREGAKVLAVDSRIKSADDTVSLIRTEGGEAASFEADATSQEDCRRMVAACCDAYGRLDILHNNVGIADGDSGPASIEEEAWDHILEVNLKSVVMPCKAALPVMREQRSGSIINISSIAAICAVPLIAYKTSKAGMNAYTQALAVGNGKHGIRANVIMPGLMNTPMAIEGNIKTRGISKEQVIAERNAQVPLNRSMGTGWDVAYAALFLASDEAKFVSGVMLPVDGAHSARVG
jgi:NAD(P)-dependent dehydrogenase (short-subunit alcohol dehydrogenase family)